MNTRIVTPKRIGVTVATALAAGAAGFTGAASGASAPARNVTSVTCPTVCPQIFAPVTCKFSDGKIRTFSNRCFAGVFACQHKLKILSCRPALD
jgi:hypothetical protein